MPRAIRSRTFHNVEVSYPASWYAEGGDDEIEAEVVRLGGRCWASGMGIGSGQRDLSFEFDGEAQATAAVVALTAAFGARGLHAEYRPFDED